MALEVLRQLGALGAEEAAALADYGPEFSIENWRKIQVGKGYPCFHLEKKA